MEKGERKREGNACIHPEASCNILLGDRAYSVLLKLDSVSFSLGGRLAFDTKDLFLCQKKKSSVHNTRAGALGRDYFLR